MKTNIFFCSGLMIGLMLITNIAFGESQGKNVGIVNALTGTVKNYHKGSSQAEIMVIGDKIYIGDRIITKQNAKVQLVFRDDTVLNLAQETELVVDADSFNHLTGKRESVFSLLKGKVRSVIGDRFSRNDSRFEIHTRTAIAGARGTENIVEAQNQPPETNVYGIDDTTYTKNVDETIEGELLLGPGNGAKIRPGKPPEPFDFNFEDPAFKEILNNTSSFGGSDVEKDINMGAFDPKGSEGPPEQKIIEPFDIKQKDLNGKPPYEEESDAQRPDVIPPVKNECSSRYP